MPLTRNLSLGMSGEDVSAVKARLLALGCYASGITTLKRNSFGADTLRAVLAFQAANGLAQDGIVGPLTFAALFGQENLKIEQTITTAQSDAVSHLPIAVASSIQAALVGQTQARQAIVLHAITFAAHPLQPFDYPRSLYIRGGNLYNTDRSPNVISLARIALGAKRQPEFYDGGRREMMERAVQNNPLITGADCSGGIVGLLRQAELVSAGFDCAADGFLARSKTTSIAKDALQSGDFLHKSGHIGLYAGGGYAVEWMGGAYGCQLTELSKRRGWNYVKQRLDKQGDWTEFLRPVYYK